MELFSIRIQRTFQLVSTAIMQLFLKISDFFKKDPVLFGKRTYVFPTIHYNKLSAIIG